MRGSEGESLKMQSGSYKDVEYHPERERCKGMVVVVGGQLGSYGDAGKRISEAFGSTMPTLDMTDVREM